MCIEVKRLKFSAEQFSYKNYGTHREYLTWLTDIKYIKWESSVKLTESTPRGAIDQDNEQVV